MARNWLKSPVFSWLAKFMSQKWNSNFNFLQTGQLSSIAKSKKNMKIFIKKNGLFHYFYYWLMTAVLFAKVASARSNASIRVSQIQPLQKCGFLGIYRRSGAKINKFWLVCRCYWSPAKKCARTLFIIVEERALMRSYCSSDPFDIIISGCLSFLMKDNCPW